MVVRDTLLGLSALVLLMVACAGGAPSDAAGDGAKVDAGAKLFSMHCTLCHGKDGKLGVSGAKDLSVSTLSKDEMIALVANGKGAMAAYKNVLTKSEIEAVVKHVRTLHATE
jgi:cytochrome c6